MKKAIPWALVGFVGFVFIQSLFFKFTGSEETAIIFNTIGDWMAGITFLAWASEPFRSYGGAVVGTAELAASGLLLFPVTRLWGALLGIGLMTGAIFFHLFTPLGVVRVVDAAGNTDGGVLFMMACAAWLCCVGTVYLNREKLPGFSAIQPQ